MTNSFTAESNNQDTSDNGASGVEATPTLEAQLTAALAKAEEHRNNHLRAIAEMENFRKRLAREVEQARKFAIERFAQELVAVGDALEAGIKVGTDTPGPALLEGAQATLRELHRAFEKAGIQTLDPADQPFDPNWHEAMVAQDSADKAPGTVLNVIQKGYALNGRLLRPARVIVAKAPAA